jgi:hypothetical protein
MKKLTTKLMISVLSVALAFIALGTSTFAWFSMNTTVEATGMQLTAVTPINLLIGDKETNPAVFTNSVEADEEYTGKLYPASSADGKIFNAIVNTGNYIGTNGQGGAADTNTKFQKTSNQTSPTVVAMDDDASGYWAVYTFQLKLSEHQDLAKNVYLSTFKVYHLVTGDGVAKSDGSYYTYAAGVYTAVPADTTLANGTPYFHLGGIATAVRGALFVGDASGSAVSATKLAIYANNAGSTDAITQTFTESGQKYDGTSKTATAAIIPANTTYFPVNDTAVNVELVVWIEGEDAACLNANAGQQFKIDLGFSVVE